MVLSLSRNPLLEDTLLDDFTTLIAFTKLDLDNHCDNFTIVSAPDSNLNANY